MALDLSPGTLVFFNDDEEGWLPGKIEFVMKGEKGVTLFQIKANDDSDEHVVPKEKIRTILDEKALEDHSDMLYLPELHTSTLLHNLKQRYAQDKIYTYTGRIIIAVNPFKKLNIYTDKLMDSYKNKQYEDNPPHIFAMADECYATLLRDSKSQSILISGESGAGKTETAKIAMKYLSHLSSKGEHGNRIRAQIQGTNPILEAFGNAKTLRNDNSSRFGKFIRLLFDDNGRLSGASIDNYLLEKSRVVSQAKGERNYHIFYMLLEGSSDELKAKYDLKSPSHYNYLNKSGCTSVVGLDEEKELKAVIESMSLIDINDEERDSVFRIVNAVLLLGNVNIIANNSDEAHIDNPKVVKAVADNLKVDAEKLSNDLLTRKNKIAKEYYVVPYTVSQAIDTRDALAKALYGSLFDWIVQKINYTINDPRADLFISLLDIFGFESFKHNFFEQFCINYANETLQQHYNRHNFKWELEACASEGIDYEAIEFEDNQSTLDLIGGKRMSILSLLDEECNFPKGSDENFLQKIKNQHSKHTAFNSPRISREQFGIEHYAEKVMYTVTKFLDKNKDALKDSLVDMMRKSKDPMIQNLLQKAKVFRGKPVTVGTQFRMQLTSLMERINMTDPHWIRCIKPNLLRQPNVFNGGQVLQQLNCSGVLETIKIRQSGYPVRLEFAHFLERYSIMQPKATGKPKQKCKAIVEFLGLDKKQCQLGTAKVFLRSETMQQIDDKLGEVMLPYVIKMQKTVRGFLTRKRIKEERKRVAAAIVFQKVWRGRRDRAIAVQLMIEKQKREEEERRRRKEEKRRKREEAERKRREEEERLKREEEERLRREEEERLRKEEEERLEAERIAEEERQRLEQELEAQKRAMKDAEEAAALIAQEAAENDQKALEEREAAQKALQEVQDRLKVHEAALAGAHTVVVMKEIQIEQEEGSFKRDEKRLLAEISAADEYDNPPTDTSGSGDVSEQSSETKSKSSGGLLEETLRAIEEEMSEDSHEKRALGYASQNLLEETLKLLEEDPVRVTQNHEIQGVYLFDTPEMPRKQSEAILLEPAENLDTPFDTIKPDPKKNKRVKKLKKNDLNRRKSQMIIQEKVEEEDKKRKKQKEEEESEWDAIEAQMAQGTELVKNIPAPPMGQPKPPKRKHKRDRSKASALKKKASSMMKKARRNSRAKRSQTVAAGSTSSHKSRRHTETKQPPVPSLDFRFTPVPDNKNVLNPYAPNAFGKGRTRTGAFSVIGNRAIYEQASPMVVWEFGRWKEPKKQHLKGPVTDISLFYGGKYAVTSGPKDLKLWDARKPESVSTLEGHSVSCLFPRGDRIITGGKDKTVRIWSLKTGKCLQTFREHENAVICVTVSLDGKLGVSASCDRTIKIWDLVNNKCIKTFHPRINVERVAVNKDKSRLVSTSGWYGNCILYNLQTMEEITQFPCDSIALFPSGKKAMCLHKGEFHIRDLDTGEYLFTFYGERTFLTASIAVFPDETKAITVSKDAYQVWHIENGEKICEFSVSPREPTCVAVKGGRIGIGCKNGTVAFCTYKEMPLMSADLHSG